MIRKVIIVLFASLLLSGCSKGAESGGTSATAEKLLEASFTACPDANNKVFKKKTYGDVASKKSTAYQTLMQKVLEKAKLKSVAETKELSFSATCILPDLDSLVVAAKEDVNGFVKDYENLKSLGTSKEDLQDYTCGYYSNVLGSAYDLEQTFTVKLVGTEESGLLIKSDQFLVDFVIQAIDKSLLDLIGETNGASADPAKGGATFSDAITGAKKFVLGKGSIIGYSLTDGSNLPLFVTPVTLVSGADALTKLSELSTANKGFTVGAGSKIQYLEYTVRNLGDKPIKFENQFKLVSSAGFPYSITGGQIIGLTTEKEITPNEDTTFSCVLVGEGSENTIVWHESATGLTRVLDKTQ